MITFLQDADIFEVNADIIVCPVNTSGVMGAGLALEFKKRFPSYFKWYKTSCDHMAIVVGEVTFYRSTDGYYGFTDICSFPSKNDYQYPSHIYRIKSGMQDLAYKIKNRSIQSIAIPKLGCGLGGLDWKDVCPVIVAALEGIECDVYILGGDVR